MIDIQKKGIIPEQILTKIDSALDSDDEITQIGLFNTLICEISVYLNYPDSAEAAYLIGYLYYLHPLKNNLYSVDSKKYLLRAFNSTTNPIIQSHSALYLGHHDYDDKSFSSALRWFQRIQIECLANYLKAKTMEMRLTCNLRLNGLAADSLDELENFICRIKEYEIQDIWPQELAQTISELDTDNISQEEAKKMRNLMKKLDNIGHYGDWFSQLRPEFA